MEEHLAKLGLFRKNVDTLTSGTGPIEYLLGKLKRNRELKDGDPLLVMHRTRGGNFYLL